jgi:SAM-dependent methyltransferase
MTDPTFAERIGHILEAGALNVTLGLGYELGLFEALDGAGPLTLAELAAKAEVDPRYLREWLGAMVSGRILEVTSEDDTEERYSLPPERGEVLCRRGGSANLGVYTQELGLLVEAALGGVRTGFRSGRGLGYERYPAFHAFMGELADRKHEQTLLQEFLPGVAEGAIQARLEAGAQVCDLGCGAGRALLLLAAAFPQSRFVGIDFDRGALAAGEAVAEQRGLSNLEFVHRDAATLASDPGPLAGRFDWITAFDAIHDQADPLASLRGVRALLAPEGCFSLIDIDAESELRANRERAMAPFLYAVSLLHCLPIGLGPEGKGAGLGMLWGRGRARELLQEAGLELVSEAPCDAFNVHYLCRQGAET